MMHVYLLVIFPTAEQVPRPTSRNLLDSKSKSNKYYLWNLI